jgi:hypothetical protein
MDPVFIALATGRSQSRKNKKTKSFDNNGLIRLNRITHVNLRRRFANGYAGNLAASPGDGGFLINSSDPIAAKIENVLFDHNICQRCWDRKNPSAPRSFERPFPSRFAASAAGTAATASFCAGTAGF